MSKSAMDSLENMFEVPFFKERKEKIHGLKILQEGIKAASPDRFLPKFVKKNRIVYNGKTIDLSSYDNLYVVAIGKAADSMTCVVDSILNISGGIVVIPHYTDSFIKKDKRYEVIKAGHPLPDRYSLKAAKKTKRFLQSKRRGCDFVLFLISGGGSSLVSYPFGTTLKEKIQLTSELMKRGATISELNCVRKHLSQVKGGKLVEDLQCDAASLVMSDVIGDYFSVISSGLTYCDSSTFEDAIRIINKYDLESQISKKTMSHLLLGRQGKIRDTPKKKKVTNVLVATNKSCLESMQKKAKQLGYSTSIKYPVKGVARTLVSRMLPYLPKHKQSCLVFGGETTVVVKGKGIGGRNQESVLASLESILKRKKHIVVASVGTDGKDGNSTAAGAMISNFEAKYGDWKDFLANNDSFSYFKRYGGPIVTGSTHTNLMDVGVILSRN